MPDADQELTQLASTAYLCKLLKPNIRLAPAIMARVIQDHDTAASRFKAKFDGMIRKILIKSLE